jgi:hypothetical protein
MSAVRPSKNFAGLAGAAQQSLSAEGEGGQRLSN